MAPVQTLTGTGSKQQQQRRITDSSHSVQGFLQGGGSFTPHRVLLSRLWVILHTGFRTRDGGRFRRDINFSGVKSIEKKRKISQNTRFHIMDKASYLNAPTPHRV